MDMVLDLLRKCISKTENGGSNLFHFYPPTLIS